jgi:hypothetical protein
MKLPMKKWGYTGIPVFLPRNFACGAGVATLLAGWTASVALAADGGPSLSATTSAPAATAPTLPPFPPPPQPISLVRPVPQVPQAPLPEALAASITEAKRKALSGEDTATTRLQALAADLEAALAALKKSPPDSAKFFAKTMADLTQAQTAVARGLDYVKAHPGENSLASRVREVKYYGAAQGGWAPYYDVYVGSWHPTDSVDSTHGGDDLALVKVSLKDGFNQFIGLPQQGRPLIGAIGGNRDLIMRAVDVVDLELVADTLDLLGAIGVLLPPPSAASAVKRMIAHVESSASVTLAALAKGLGDPDHTGSIAGTAAPTDPALFCDALITIAALDSPDPPSGLQYSESATYADESGNFVIKNLPPGFYLVGAVGGSLTESANRVVVEVKEGAATKMPEPLKYDFSHYHGGRG